MSAARAIWMSLIGHTSSVIILYDQQRSNGTPPALSKQMFLSDSGTFRVLIFAIAGGAAVLAGFVYIPPLLRPGIPVSRFRQLPRAVAQDLNLRGCNIVRGRNVISGDFDGTGQRGWAVLCQRDNQASLFIYLAGSSKPAIFDTHGAGLVDDAETARGIRIADWAMLRSTTPEFG